MIIDFPKPFAKNKDDDWKEELKNNPDIDLSDIPRKRRSKDTPPREDAPVRTRRAVSLAEQIGIFVGDINSILLMLPWTHDDALTAIEETHLVKSWDNAQKVDKRLRTWTERITTTGGRVGLIGCVAGIIAARLMRHGLIPMPPMSEQQKQMMAEQLARMQYAEQARNGYVPHATNENPYVSVPADSPLHDLVQEQEDMGNRVSYVTPDGMVYRTRAE